MEKPLVEVYKVLQTLLGLHRQLLEVIRNERVAIIDVDLKEVQKYTDIKKTLIESIHTSELSRIKFTSELAILWKTPLRELTLPNISIAIQDVDPKGAEQFRSIYNTLTLLIQRISEQNTANAALIESSLEHIHEMKKNILGESTAKSNTYTQRGKKSSAKKTSRLISREA